jgi:hypothetical protein
MSKTFTLEDARLELIQEPDYRRMDETAFTYYSRVYLAFKMAYGPEVTIQDWMKHEAQEEQRAQFAALKELIRWEDNNA